MDVSQSIKTLEKYEAQARELGIKDWHSDIGDNLYEYLVYCKNNKQKPNLENYLAWIDGMANMRFKKSK